MQKYQFDPIINKKYKIFSNSAKITYSYFGRTYIFQTKINSIKNPSHICTKKIKKEIFLTKIENKIRKLKSAYTLVESVNIYDSAKNRKIIFVKGKVIIDYTNTFLKSSKIIKSIIFDILLPEKTVTGNMKISVNNTEIFKINSEYLIANIFIEVSQI